MALKRDQETEAGTQRRNSVAATRDAMALAVDEATALRGDEVHHTQQTQIDLALIAVNGGTQMRAGLNEETVVEYAEAMIVAGDYGPFPPVAVYYDGSVYWLADGFHRVEAARRVLALEGEAVRIPAVVKVGDRRKAILEAAKANATHGLRRTNADKRRAVEVLLDDDEWGQWSDRKIAEMCRVSAPFVAKVRNAEPETVADDELLTVNIYSEKLAEAPAVPGNIASEDEPPKSAATRTYTTKHGTTATMDTGNIGAKPKPRPEPPIPTQPVYVEPEPPRDAQPEPDDLPTFHFVPSVASDEPDSLPEFNPTQLAYYKLLIDTNTDARVLRTGYARMDAEMVAMAVLNLRRRNQHSRANLIAWEHPRYASQPAQDAPAAPAAPFAAAPVKSLALHGNDARSVQKQAGLRRLRELYQQIAASHTDYEQATGECDSRRKLDPIIALRLQAIDKELGYHPEQKSEEP